MVTLSEDEKSHRLKVTWASLALVTVVVAVFASSGLSFWSIMAGGLPAIALLVIEMTRHPFRKRTKVSNSISIRHSGGSVVTTQSSDQELNHR